MLSKITRILSKNEKNVNRSTHQFLKNLEDRGTSSRALYYGEYYRMSGLVYSTNNFQGKGERE